MEIMAQKYLVCNVNPQICYSDIIKNWQILTYSVLIV